MVILDLVEKVAPIAEGMSVRLPTSDVHEVALARSWCTMTGNTLVTVADGWVEVRRGRPVPVLQALPPERRPGVRLWIYTNFDCNLACSYCCVRSSPRALRRALGRVRIARLAEEAAAWGVAEFWLTGGEPFVLADIGEIILACVAQRPTTVLTNGMLFSGRRLQTLASLPRDDLALQISLDSVTPGRHDCNRGQGSWAKAMNGIRIARELGFRVRVAATVDPRDQEAISEAEQFGSMLDHLGIAREDQLTRPIARRGVADSGLELKPEMMVPEVTVTAEGIYWHPVGADDPDMLIDPEIFPLSKGIDRVIELFEAYRQQMRSAAMIFPCA